MSEYQRQLREQGRAVLEKLKFYGKAPEDFVESLTKMVEDLDQETLTREEILSRFQKLNMVSHVLDERMRWRKKILEKMTECPRCKQDFYDERQEGICWRCKYGDTRSTAEGEWRRATRWSADGER